MLCESWEQHCVIVSLDRRGQLFVTLLCDIMEQHCVIVLLDRIDKLFVTVLCESMEQHCVIRFVYSRTVLLCCVRAGSNTELICMCERRE